MIKFEKTSYELLENTINEIFKEQDKHYFEKDIEKKTEEIAIGAYAGEKIIGGIVARKEYQNIHISLLVVKDDYRGQQVGSRLVLEIEKIARGSDIINLTLTTKSYQAVDFYKKLGFTIYATLEDMPMKGVKKYYFNKKI